MHPVLLTAFLLSPSLSLATSDAERRHVYLLRRSDICTENNKIACDSRCMPLGSVCCDDGSGSYCHPGTVCIPNGCCPEGETCVGGGGTMTIHDILTGTGSLPTDPPRITVHVGGPKATGAAPAGWNRGLEFPMVLLMAGQLVL